MQISIINLSWIFQTCFSSFFIRATGRIQLRTWFLHVQVCVKDDTIWEIGSNKRGNVTRQEQCNGHRTWFLLLWHIESYYCLLGMILILKRRGLNSINYAQNEMFSPLKKVKKINLEIRAYWFAHSRRLLRGSHGYVNICYRNVFVYTFGILLLQSAITAGSRLWFVHQSR